MEKFRSQTGLGAEPDTVVERVSSHISSSSLLQDLAVLVSEKQSEAQSEALRYADSGIPSMAWSFLVSGN